MKNKIGVMQGRLLPKYHGLYQAHPLGYWQEEFEIAKTLGLGCIEFIFDFNDANKNPLYGEGGVEEILAVSKKTSVSVETICADYFMEAPLHSQNKSVAQQSQEILIVLLEKAQRLGVSDIVIPCVDQASLNSREAVDRFVNHIHKVLPSAEKNKINLSLETDLAPQPFVELLDKFNSNRVTVNYDIGNSAALGYDLEEELNAYGHRITDVHIKDRLFSGNSVILGKGNADFKKFFKKIDEVGYKGPFIMQVYRDDEGVEIFKKQLEWVTPHFNVLQ
jgi:L-ribulose-5-phosphate 3-epimerase